MGYYCKFIGLLDVGWSFGRVDLAVLALKFDNSAVYMVLLSYDLDMMLLSVSDIKALGLKV